MLNIIIIRLSGKPLQGTVEARLATGYKLHPHKRLRNFCKDRDSVFLTITDG